MTVQINKNIQPEMADKAIALIRDLNKKVVEREELVGLIVLALCSRSNMFLIGKPGVAKTKVLKHAISAIKDTKSFEHLMMYDTKVEDIFGERVMAPNGEMIHNYENTAVTAHYILEDEFFKGSSRIVNGYLGVASDDREYHPRGGEPINVPLRTLFAASNEFHDNEAMDAMNDRLPLRYEVARIQEEENFIKMIRDDFDSSDVFESDMSLEDVDNIYRESMEKVTISDSLAVSFQKLKIKLISEEKMEASDRRLKSAIKIMKVSAYLNNRLAIDESDFFLLNHIVWNNLTERDQTKKSVFRHLFSSKNFVEKILLDAESSFNEISAQKQAYLNDFLMKKENIAIKDLEVHFLKKTREVQILISKIGESYVKIAEILDIANENARIRELAKDNIFIPNQEDTIFKNGLDTSVEKCKNAHQSLYRYLDDFLTKCPNIRAYKNYTGQSIG